MMKQTCALLLCSALCVIFPLDAFAASGFSEVGSYTDTKNQYYFDTDAAVLVYNKEAETDPDYDKIWAGSDLYIPVYVYPNGEGNGEIASDKLIKSDSVGVSAKVTRGTQYVGDVTIVDGKKLKIDDLPAGAYARIPFSADYQNLAKTTVSVRLVLSVKGVSYQETRATLNVNLSNRVEEIAANSVYGAQKPTQFKVASNYNGDATFDFGENIRYTAKVKAGKKYYLNMQRTANEAITDMYPDAHLEFYSFSGKDDAFESKGKLEIPVKRDQFKDKNGSTSLYAYRVDGSKLVALGEGDITFNSKADKLTIHTDSLDNYVLANRALMATVNENTENILKTGYAQTASGEISQIEDTREPGTSSGGQSSSTASGAAGAQSAASSAAGAANEVPNNNVSTGLPINADNKSGDNPPTGASSAMPVAFTGIVCGAVLLGILRKAPRNQA